MSSQACIRSERGELFLDVLFFVPLLLLIGGVIVDSTLILHRRAELSSSIRTQVGQELLRLNPAKSGEGEIQSRLSQRISQIVPDGQVASSKVSVSWKTREEQRLTAMYAHPYESTLEIVPKELIVEYEVPRLEGLFGNVIASPNVRERLRIRSRGERLSIE
jgi:hypothetical protein